MRVQYFLAFFIFLLSVDAQRRSVKSELLSENEPTPKSARRGRARFTVTSDSPPLEEQPERRIPSRRKPEVIRTEITRKGYEVAEVFDDTPYETYRKPTKTVTETKFEASNAPAPLLFQPSTTESFDEVIKSIGTGILDTTLVPESATSFVELTASEETKIDEVSRTQPETTTAATKRSNGRLRNLITSTTSAPTVRSRSRVRATRAPTDATPPTRNSRRRNEPAIESRRNEPVPTRSQTRSRFAPAENVPVPARPTEARSRFAPAENEQIQSRRVAPAENEEVPSRRVAPTEAVPVTSPRSRFSIAENEQAPSRRVAESRPTETRRTVASTEAAEAPARSRGVRRRNEQAAEVTTFRSRSRARSRELPQVSIEPKPEALPLVQRRPRVVARRRSFNSAEEVETAATENDVKIAIKPKESVKFSVETKTESSIKRRKVTRKPLSTSRPMIKESVVQEITEVTSKRTVVRKLPKTFARSTKKPETKKSKSPTSSEEEIDESDNYPEQFKALIQAKKQKKESRPQSIVTAAPAVTKITEKVATSSPSASPQVITTEANRQLDAENEIKPAKSTLPTRRRFVPAASTATRPTRKSFTRSTTTAASSPTREHRFHAKFNTDVESSSSNPVKGKSFSAKPPRGVYSSRKTKESLKNKSTTQIPTPKKASRYSSRYRNDASTRSAIRTSTSAPAYLPTIPTVTPSTTAVKSTQYQDKILGVEVISFDDPVNTVPSANLINGEYVPTSTETAPNSTLVSASQSKSTEKQPVSIIERIINSITAISTTEVPTKLTTPLQEPSTKQTAILKLAAKKSDKPSTTQKIPAVTVTSEKPTTIIERILSSLNAIQADNATDVKKFKSRQVGTNFNTISSPSTTPISRVTKSALYAPISTSMNPLFILDEISNDQTLQKRTIDRLLALLNTLTTPSSRSSTPLVVVTPKSSFNTGEPTTSSTTTVPTTTLFTSPTTGQTTTTVRYTTTPTDTTLRPSTTTENPTSTQSNDIGAVPLSLDFGTTSSDLSSTTDPSLSLSSTLPTSVATETNFIFPSTLPALANFKVSPGSVSVFSANDLSNAITPEDFSSTTVTISGRTNVPEIVTTQTDPTNSESSTTDSGATTIPTTTDNLVTLLSSTTDGTTVEPVFTTTVNNEMSSTIGTVESNTTSTVSPPTNTTTRGRGGRLLDIIGDPGQNSIESSNNRTKDYFIFAVLNNNTILRKRPSTFPTKDTPYLIVGVYPNNTIVKKFPNGTLVPMEPVIRVSGFDTRENPPPLPEITSNQVTPDQGSPPENKTLQTVDQNTIPPFEANPLSLNTVNTDSTTAATVSTTQSTTPISSTSTTTVSSTSTSSSSTAPATTSTTSTTTTSTPLPPLTEILNGKTVKAFNSIINISDLTKVQTLAVDPKTNETSTTPPPPTLSNRILSNTIPSTFTIPTTTLLPSTTAVPTTAVPTTTALPTTITIPPSTAATYTTSKATTVLPLSQPITYQTTTSFPSTTFLPTFLTTLLSTFRPRQVTTTEDAITIVTPIPNIIDVNTVPDMIFASTTRRTRVTTVPTTTLPPTTRHVRRRTTTTPEPTTTFTTTTTTTTTTSTTPAPTTTTRRPRRTTTEAITTTTDGVKRLRQLTDQQKKDLQTLAQLEKEQAQILQQLAFLTNLNVANTKSTTDKNSLANRIVALAVDRDKDRQKPAEEGSRQPKKLPDEANIDELLKQINQVTPSTLTKEYGTSDDAIIAALLKEQGIGPKTPKALEDVYSLTTTTTRRPRTTARPRRPLMDSLNWLLNVLAPTTTTKRPRPKKKPKPKPKPAESDELLTHQPTHITPVVTQAPRQNIVSSLSQADIQKLITQLEGIQKNPRGAKELDLSSIKSLQDLINSEDKIRGVRTGTTTPEPTTTRSTTKRKKSRVAKSSTEIPISVSNSIVEDEVVSTTTKPRVTLPPVRLRPVPGIEDDGPMVRGQLITAAVNVTRAISSFLGTALQGAASGFQSLLGSGSRAVGSLMQVSSRPE